MFTQLFTIAALLSARGTDHRVVYHLEVADGNKTVVSQDVTIFENHPAEQFRYALNYRELVIDLAASKVAAQQLQSSMAVTCNSSNFNSKGLIVGEQELTSQTTATCRIGETQAFDVSDKLVEFLQNAKHWKPAKDHLLVSISYKKVVDGPY